MTFTTLPAVQTIQCLGFMTVESEHAPNLGVNQAGYHAGLVLLDQLDPEEVAAK